ncbi:MAG: hypothetical protein CM1200mP30_31970 [Pseudomonadota bacterium]|nr:MAG: hypothetical protein CM1200mP30_31970 [Pseudomonadota bacterium]
MDGNQYFNRPGPRLVDSAEIMAEIIHPEILKENIQKMLGLLWFLTYFKLINF